eukprot:TRINITY_DN24635_c0_g1_i3.p1 TRINITY_DN24635_c0_g1~~TRINITY_DN24635_c0_g1_i3.p1  ORF type:complete len:482 (+),score=67.24 TRINITY_DN24635_c0_g1_i3:61-1506(+)
MAAQPVHAPGSHAADMAEGYGEVDSIAASRRSESSSTVPGTVLEALKPLELIVKNTFFDTPLERPFSLEDFLKERLAISCPATRQNTLERGKSQVVEEDCFAEVSPCASLAATSAGESLSSGTCPHHEDDDMALEGASSPRGSWCSTPRDMDDMCIPAEEEGVRASPVAISGSGVLPGRRACAGGSISGAQSAAIIPASIVEKLRRDVVAEVEARLTAVGCQASLQHALLAGLPGHQQPLPQPFPIPQMPEHPSLLSNPLPPADHAPLYHTVPLFGAPVAVSMGTPLQPRMTVRQPQCSMDTPMMMSQPQQAVETPLLLSTAPQLYHSQYQPQTCSSTSSSAAPLSMSLVSASTWTSIPMLPAKADESAAIDEADGCSSSEYPLVTTNPGSDAHDGTGKCMPCMFVHEESRCRAGVDCQYCHKCPPGEQRRRKAAKLHEQKRRRRQERQARKLAAAAAGEVPALPWDDEDDDETDAFLDAA